ncbi:hypothetical protein Y032_0019g3831 [Ancylostoma ceylanicum]|nr:hypothetical protein Y032_0019g3831 [Ancylostoma ceylanicum]
MTELNRRFTSRRQALWEINALARSMDSVDTALLSQLSKHLALYCYPSCGYFVENRLELESIYIISVF